MCVSPSQQGKGIGGALLEDLQVLLVSEGVRKVYLLTSRDAFAAEFYKKREFYISERMIMMGKWLGPRE